MKNLESQLQQACIKYFDLQYPQYSQILFAVPNGGLRNKRVAATLKREGVRAGVADLFFAKPSHYTFSIEGLSGRNALLLQPDSYHGLFIEMKVGKGKQTEAQIAFEKAVTAQGYAYKIVRTFDEFQDLINNWIA